MTTWILLNAALKGTIVLGAAWLLTIVLRKRSAASRHLVWTAAAAAVTALPFLSLGLPVLRLPARANQLIDATGVVFRVVSTVAPEAPLAALPVTAPSTPANGGNISFAAAGLLPWIWALGTAVLLLQTAAAYIGMWRKRRVARPFDDRGLTSGFHV